MKKTFLGLTVVTLILTGCGKDNKVVTVPNQNSNANAFTTGVLAQGGMPKAKDSVRFNQKKTYRTTGSSKCTYVVDTNVIVLRSQGDRIRIKVNNKSVRTGRNSSYCPSYHPTMRDVRYASMTSSEFVTQTTEKINLALNPAAYCAKSSDWCANARLIQKTDVTKYGKPALFVEAEFQNKNGRIFNRKSYISKTSLLENVFEFEMVNVRTGERVDFKSPKPDRRRRRPRN